MISVMPSLIVSLTIFNTVYVCFGETGQQCVCPTTVSSTTSALTTSAGDTETSTSAAPTTSAGDTETSTSSAPTTSVVETETSTSSAPTTSVGETETSTSSAPTTSVDETETSTTSAPRTSVGESETSTTTAPTTSVEETETSTTSTLMSTVGETETSTTSTPKTSVRETVTSSTSTPMSTVGETETSSTSTLMSTVIETETSSTSTLMSTVGETKTSTTSTPMSTVGETETSSTSTPTTSVGETETSSTSTPMSTVGETETSSTSTLMSTVAETETSTTSTPMSTVGETETSMTSTPMSTFGETETSTTSTPTTSVGEPETSSTSTPMSTVGETETSSTSTPMSTVGETETSTTSTTMSTVGETETSSTHLSTSPVSEPVSSSLDPAEGKRKKRNAEVDLKINGHWDEDGNCVCDDATTPKYEYEPSTENVEANLNLSLKVGGNDTFVNETLQNKTSQLFKDFQFCFKNELWSFYNDTTGFKNLTVDDFSNGSIIVLYTVIVEAKELISAAEYIYSNVTPKMVHDLKNIIIGNLSLAVDAKSITDSSTAAVDTAHKDGCSLLSSPVCHIGYVCKLNSKVRKPKCEHKCTEDTCGEHGECTVNVNDMVSCKCREYADVVYHGERCEVKSEKLTLSSTYIIVICAVGGGVLLIIAIAATICLLREKKRQSDAKHKRKVSNDESVSVQDLPIDRLNNFRLSGNSFQPWKAQNEYHSGLLNQDKTFLQGREHRVVRGDQGEETYFYQPKLPRPQSDPGSDYRSIYDYIDTESKFEIRRPDIKLGNLYKF